MRSTLMFVLCCSVMISSAVLAQADRIAADIKLVEKLLTKSSLAKAVTLAGSATQPRQSNPAVLFLEKAKKAYKEGNKDLAAEYIRQAKMAMFSAAKQASGKNSNHNKLKRDYKKRVRNVSALLDALQRINQEKQQSQQSRASEGEIHKQLARADSLFRQGEFEQAKESVEATFLLAKQSVISLRDGDTLVRELNFANKEEEYKYELDRNHTHQMLVTVLLKQKMKNPSIAKKVNERLADSEQRRLEAARQAKKGDFESAVKTLEDATKYIIRAIRAAGIYIPG